MLLIIVNEGMGLIATLSSPLCKYKSSRRADDGLLQSIAR